MLINLLEETEFVMKQYGKTWEDVEHICGNEFSISKENFINVAKETDYDNGFGGQEIAYDLKIVGKNWWLERSEYDGSEWWVFKTYPIPPTLTCEVKKLSSEDPWCNLNEIMMENI